MMFALVGVTGEVVNLNSGPIMMGTAPRIWAGAPIQLTKQPAAGRSAGEPDGDARHLARPVRFSLKLEADSAQALPALVERTSRLLDATRGNIRLVVDREDGTAARELLCRVTSAPMVVDNCGSSTLRAPVVARAADPYWHDTTASPNVTDFSLVGLAGGLRRQVAVEVHNPGSAPTWPRWQLGPSTNGPWIMSNTTTGRVWRWTASTTHQNSILVETKEGARNIWLASTKQSLRRGLDVTQRDLWPLAPGLNRITVETGGVQTAPLGERQCLMTWSPRWNEC